MTDGSAPGRGTVRAHTLLEVTPHLYPDVVGGIPLSVNGLATALSNEFETTVVANWMGSTRPPTDRRYNLVTFPTRLVLLGNPISVRMFVWLLTHVADFDVVHAHSHLFLSSTIAVVLAKLRGTHVVLTNHGFISFSQPIPLQHLWIVLVSKTILSMCDRILCFSVESFVKRVSENCSWRLLESRTSRPGSISRLWGRALRRPCSANMLRNIGSAQW